MRSKDSLRRRILSASVLLTLVVCGFFAGVAFLTISVIEHQVIHKRLTNEADWLIARHRQGIAVELPPGSSFYRAGDIPESLRALAPGFHELNVAGRTLFVVALNDGGERFVVVDAQSDFERIEDEVLLALSAGFVGGLLLAVFLGHTTASRVIAPVSALARAVERDTPEDNLPSLGAADEIGVLARAFAKRTAQLRAFLVRERLFTGDVSHELRTPLTVILGAVELLTAQLGGRPELNAAAERIRRAAVDATDRVSALLLLSRSPERLDAPRIALTPLLVREQERCQPLLKGKPVALAIDAAHEVWVYARPELAAIAIGNLMRNACQHTEHGTVTVRLAPGSLMVEDMGPGLPAAVRARLFARLVRVRDDQSPSSGLGLALVKRVAEHLRWDVRLEDIPTTGGSRFILTFPSA